MTVSETAALLTAVRAIAEQAGRAIMAIYADGFSVTAKDDHSPLTEADLAAHRLIVAALNTLTPQWPVLSEESSAEAVAERLRWPRYWLVDPLDGTREFIKRNGEFSVNIALVDHHESVLGVIHAPVAGYCCSGARGHDAEMIEADGSRRRLQARSERPACLRVAGSRSHGAARLALVLDRIGDHECIAMGSALKFCLIAAGSADVYFRFGPTCEWDTAAGQAIIEAAGGQVTDLDLKPLRYNQRDHLINPDFIAYADPSAPWREWLAAAHGAASDER